MLSSTPNTELTMPSPSAPLDLTWARPLPKFRPRKEGEPQREYLRLLGEFQVAAAKEQKAAHEAKLAEESSRQQASGTAQ